MLLYCSSAFQNDLTKKWTQIKLAQIQRGYALNISKAYRTVSTNAALLLVGLGPLHLTGLYKAKITNIKMGVEVFSQLSNYTVEQSEFPVTQLIIIQ